MKEVKLNSKRSVLTFMGLLALITLEAQHGNAQPQCGGIFSSLGFHRSSGSFIVDLFPAEEVKVKTRNEYSDNLQRLESVLATEVAKGGWLRNSLSYYKDIAASIEGRVISGIQGTNDLQSVRLFAGRVVSVKPANGINYNDGYEAIIDGHSGLQKISTNDGLITKIYIAKAALPGRMKTGDARIDSIPAEEIKTYSREDYSNEYQRLVSIHSAEVTKGGWLKSALENFKDIAAAIEGQVISGTQMGNDFQTVRLFSGRVISVKPANGVDFSDGYEAVIEGPLGRQTISTDNGLIQNLHIAKSESKRIKTGNERIDSIPAEELKTYSRDDYSKESKRLEAILTAQVEKGGWKRNTNVYYKDIAEAIKGKVIAGTQLGRDMQTVLLFAGRVVLVKPENGVDYSEGYDIIIEGALGFQTISSRGGYINNLYIAEDGK